MSDISMQDLTDDEIVLAKADLDLQIKFLREQKMEYQQEEERRATEYIHQRLVRAAAEQGFTLEPTSPAQRIDVIDIPSEGEVYG